MIGMTPPDPDRDPLEELAEEFVGRLRRGERPALTEYADRHPDLADHIRTLFPALLLDGAARPGRPPPAAAPGPARRVPPPPGGRPRRHGRRVRGGAGVARPAGGAEGAPGRPVLAGSAWSGSAGRRRRRPGCTTPTSSRCSASARRAARTSTPCSSSTARGWTGARRGPAAAGRHSVCVGSAPGRAVGPRPPAPDRFVRRRIDRVGLPRSCRRRPAHSRSPAD